MKHFLFTILTLLAFSVNGFCQLQKKTVEQAHNFTTIYKVPMRAGEIRYSNDYGYILFGSTNNRFEDKMASIILGSDQESAILTLRDLKELKIKVNEPVIVNGFAGKETTILFDPLNGNVFETQGVAGISYALVWMKYDKAIQAVEEFTKPE